MSATARPLFVCFSHEDVAVFHYKEGEKAAETLCGKRAFPPYPKRTRVTCETCKERKPRQFNAPAAVRVGVSPPTETEGGTS